MILYQKNYGAESLSDLERDVSEAIQADYNPKAEILNTNQDEHGFFKGHITVTITFHPESES